MDAKLFLIVFICIAALGLVLGIAIGFNPVSYTHLTLPTRGRV